MQCGNGIEFDYGMWDFNNDRVVENFESHVSMSIPSYHRVHNLTTELIKSRYIPKDRKIRVLDIGCSLGTLDVSIEKEWEKSSSREIEIVAMDISKGMIDKCKEIPDTKVNFICGNPITKLIIEKEKYDVIICLYVLQFIENDYKRMLLKEIYEKLSDDGVLILADKFKSDIDFIESKNEYELRKYKMEMGFSREEIDGKRSSLSMKQDRMYDSYFLSFLMSTGFKTISPMTRDWNFASYVIKKGGFGDGWTR